MTIVRTPTRAEGGITEEEKIALGIHTDMWIKRILRTEPADRVALTSAIKDLYKVSGLSEPEVIIVDSPIQMVAKYGAEAALHYMKDHPEKFKNASEKKKNRKKNPTYVERLFQECYERAGDLGIECAKKWLTVCQGGAYWGQYDAFLTAMRDIIGLDLPEYKTYDAWERSAINGTFRVMHEKFCIVCDFPEFLRMDDEHRPHGENGPSHRWRDGWELYHWHGISVPERWIMDRENVDPSEILMEENVERRAAGAEIIGWAKMASALDMKVIDGYVDSDLGALVELTLPGLPESGRFLMARCPRNGTICEGVPRVSEVDNLPINTAIAAQAWRIGDPQSEYEHPTRRT